MTDFTRLTVIGSARKAELVVPDDESLSVLLPRVMDLLEEPTGSVDRPLTLVRSTGEQLDASRSTAEQQVADGELLRLVRADDVPPPPEVADVTDVLAETHADRPGRWSSTSREVTGAVALGGIGFALAAATNLGPGALSLAVVALALLALLVGRFGVRWGAIAGTALALGAVVPAASSLVAAGSGPGSGLEPAVGLATLALGLGWTVVGAGVGIGLGRRPALVGALIGLGLTALSLITRAGGLGSVPSAAITGSVAVVACGLLPWWAMATAGLTGLDDQVLQGRPRRRSEVATTVDSAYNALTWSAVAVAAPLAGAGAVLLSTADRWAVGLGATVLAVTALRTRAFPLAAQQMALWLSAGTGAALGLWFSPMLPRPGLVLALLGAALAVVAGVAARPAAHHRARLRRWGNLVEALAVMALIPLLLGVFGVYSDLLQAFR